MKPRKNFRSRPKKLGAKKRQKVLSQKRRLVSAGHKQEDLDKLTPVETRELLKKSGKMAAKAKKAKSAAAKAKKTSAKPTAPKAEKKAPAKPTKKS